MLDQQPSEEIFDERIIPVVQNIESQKSQIQEIIQKSNQISSDLYNIQESVLNLQK